MIIAGKIEIATKLLIAIANRQKSITGIAGLCEPIAMVRVLKKQGECLLVSTRNQSNGIDAGLAWCDRGTRSSRLYSSTVRKSARLSSAISK